MDAHSWSRVAVSSRRYPHHSTSVQSRFDPYVECEEFDGGEDDSRAEFACPFCSEDFDIVELCCHIDDEHQVEAQNGVCPVCEARVGMDMVGHITMEHAIFFKMHRRRRYHKGFLGSFSTFPLLKKELREGNLQSLLGGSSYTVPSSNAVSDPSLASFIHNYLVANSSKDIVLPELGGAGSASKKQNDKILERDQIQSWNNILHLSWWRMWQ